MILLGYRAGIIEHDHVGWTASEHVAKEHTLYQKYFIK